MEGVSRLGAGCPGSTSCSARIKSEWLILCTNNSTPGSLGCWPEACGCEPVTTDLLCAGCFFVHQQADADADAAAPAAASARRR